MRLKKDIVIPAGTELSPAPWKTLRYEGHVEAIVGLSKDSTASFVFYPDDGLDDILDYDSADVKPVRTDEPLSVSYYGNNFPITVT